MLERPPLSAANRSRALSGSSRTSACASYLALRELTMRLTPSSPRRLGICMLASLSGFLFGYDQGVVGNVLVLESFGAAYPRIYMNASLKVCSSYAPDLKGSADLCRLSQGWWVSTLLLAAWFGSLVNGPLVSMHGRRRNIQFHTITFVLGAALQTGARNEGYLFAGRAIAGFSVGALTHTAPMYIAEVSDLALRRTRPGLTLRSHSSARSGPSPWFARRVPAALDHARHPVLVLDRLRYLAHRRDPLRPADPVHRRHPERKPDFRRLPRCSRRRLHRPIAGSLAHSRRYSDLAGYHPRRCALLDAVLAPLARGEGSRQ